MIKVLFFASLREQVGCSTLDWAWTEDLATLAALRQQLSAQGPNWAEALAADNILCALNQVQADDASVLADGDEVAFFPPVTGG